MEITEVKPSQVSLKLDFTRPFKANNLVDFTLAPRGDATEITWDMHGPTPFMGKVVPCWSKLKDFETGLASLKAIAPRWRSSATILHSLLRASCALRPKKRKSR